MVVFVVVLGTLQTDVHSTESLNDKASKLDNRNKLIPLPPKVRILWGEIMANWFLIAQLFVEIFKFSKIQ